MNDTQKYIQAYKKALPRMKEKVMAAVSMLVISAIMATSASFAWVALSVNPEVSNIETTVAANGNLEIALSDKDGAEPEKSQIGDSGKDLVKKNITWGNLVNLSDESYGLGEIILRPAQLNTTGNLLTAPLKIVTYGSDGRVDKFSSSLKFANYDLANDTFVVPGLPEYGVRAITTVTYKNLTGNTDYMDMVETLENKFSYANSIYGDMLADQDNIDALIGLIGAFVDNKLNGGSPDVTQYVPALYGMMVSFSEYVEQTGEVMCQIALMQQYPYVAKENLVYYSTVDDLCNATSLAEHVSLKGLSLYKTTRTNMKSTLAKMKTLNDAVTINGDAVVWSQIAPLVSVLVDISTTTLDGIEAKDLGVGNALGFMSGTHEAVIHKGAIKDMEQLMGRQMQKVGVVEIRATYKGIPATVKATVETSATEPFIVVEEKIGVDNYEGGFAGGDAVAEETYGLAMDFWLRTNSSNAYLVLEGNPIIEQVEKKDENNETVKDAEGNPVLIDAVTGYEGENRVWDDSTLSEFSTTQGNGSCYVFYVDDPVHQQKSLDLLDSIKLAFVDADGEILATASMDTEHAFEETGKVTVPIVLDPDSMQVLDANGEAVLDEKDNPIYALTKMESGIAKRITAIFYADGTSLFNEDVLADANMQGQLNIQFGISENMTPVDDDELKYEEISVSAVASKDEFDYDAGDELKTTITLTVSGVDPTKAEANFVRAINATQGSRGETFAFTKTAAANQWTADVEFTSPGDYVLREVTLDGVTYELVEPVEINISGYGISHLSCDKSTNSAIMTADKSLSATYTLEMSATENRPNKIQAVIVDEDGNQMITDFVAGAEDYTTTATFESSGTYTLKYLIIDGQWKEIEPQYQRTLVLYLGMTAKVMLSETEFKVDKKPQENPHEIKVYVNIYNDKGEEFRPEEDLSITYRHRTSSYTAPLFDKLEWNADWDYYIPVDENGEPYLDENDEPIKVYRNRYAAKFSVKDAGYYDFAMISVGKESNLESADAPSIKAIPPDEPNYARLEVPERQFKPNNDATLTVRLTDSRTLTSAVFDTNGNMTTEGDVKATIRYLGKDGTNINGPTAVAYGVMGTDITNAQNKAETRWIFTLPNKALAMEDQEGFWEIVDVTATFPDYEKSPNEDGSQPTKSKYWKISEVNTDGDRTVTEVTLDIANNVNVVLSGTSQSFTEDVIMADHYINDLGVTITDKVGNTINDIKNVQFTYTLEADRIVFNTTSEIPTEKTTLAVGSTVVENTGGKQFKIEQNKMNLLYNGTYTIGVQFEFKDVVYYYGPGAVCDDGVITSTITATGAPVYSVTWKKPDVQVTGISPTNVNIDSTNASFSGLAAVNKVVAGTATNTYGAYNFVAYCNSTVGTTLRQKVVTNVSLSSVDMKAVNMGTASSVTIVLPKGETSEAVEYIFTSEGESISHTIGEIADWRIDFLRIGFKEGKLIAPTATNVENATVVVNDVTYTYTLTNPISVHTPN